MPTTYLMLLWHQHQPFYKNLDDDTYTMPWVRLHALKDYYGMAAMLREFPSVRVTVNLVPSLIIQLEDYVRDAAREEAYDLAFQPAEKLSTEERKRLLYFAFQINRENLLYRYPRFRELYEKAKPWELGVAMAPLFSVEELRDLQVVSQLAWFDEIYLANDPAIRALVEKQRGYSESDQALLKGKEIELMRAVLDEHRAASERGQIELSTSPFYHPILPLLCDTQVAAQSHPGITLPSLPFRHPEDARAQLRAARELHQRVFGRPPRGLWPSEGSVSDEVLKIAAEEGFAWAATDEGVLGRSLGIGLERDGDGTLRDGRELYRPHRFRADGREISLLFRDHQLSDLIGFVYSRMDPDAAAADLCRRIHAAGRTTAGRSAVVSIILDGENAWEFYPRNGREFLRRFYGRVACDPELKTVTASEALEVTEGGSLTHVVPGSWINANFDVWIGSEEDNRAWELLAQARDFFAERSAAPGVSEPKRRLAEQELWIAEGSDWCWWYGPEHSTANDEEFDLLYRRHLGNVYRLLGTLPPDELAVPIKRPRGEALNVPPTGPIEPQVDGVVTNYFEWLGAGVYSPSQRAGSMHGLVTGVDVVYYGYSEEAFCLRLDFNRVFVQEHPDFGIRINFNGDRRARLHVRVRGGAVTALNFWRDERKLAESDWGDNLRAAFGRIFEARFAYQLLGITDQSSVSLQVAIWKDELPFQVIPEHGWLTLQITKELQNW